MPSVKRLLSLLAVFSLSLLAACGGGGAHNNPLPPPSGGFTPADLNGTYVFSTAGNDSAGGFLNIAGTFTANGNLGITSGTISISGGAVGTASNVAVGGNSSYILTADGRGQITLTNIPGLRTIVVDFVLTSSDHGLITEFDANGTGSGTLDLQKAVTQAQLAGPYAFSLFGTDLSGNSVATVGSLTLDASGTIGSGVQDFNAVSNSADTFTGNLPVTGSVSLGSSGAPGTAKLTATGSTFGTLSFDVYAVDSTHLKFIETDSAAFLSGDVFTQQGAALPTTATTLVFTMAGGVSAPIAAGGFMPVDGTGGITNGSVDINSGGTVTASPLNFTGSYAASGTVGGRTLFNLSGFSIASQFVAYPTTSAGLQMLQSDGAGLISGAAFEQSSTSIAATQGYGLGISAANLGIGVEEDDIAEFTTTSSSFSGLIDFNDQGSPNQAAKLSGNYQPASPPSGRYSVSSSAFSGVFYAVDSSTALFVDLDSVLIGTGILQLQNAGAKAGLASPHVASLPRPSGRAIRGHRVN